MVKWVAEIFNEFELYKLEFNKQASGSDLMVATSPLTLDNLSASNDHFEGHLSTRHWALAFDASTRKLDVYLIPSELVLAFTTSRIDETEYKPFITFTPRRHRDEYYWSVEQRTITFDMLPKLAKELFGDLIKVASGNVSEQEFFRSAPNEAAEIAKHEAEIASTDRSFESNTVPDAGPENKVFFSGEFPSRDESALDPGLVGAASGAGANGVNDTAKAKRDSAITDAFFSKCAEFTSYLDSEMKAVIDFAKLEPENVELLQNCKQIITELDLLQVATVDSSERLRQIRG
jgi:hypothetical protein